MFRYPSGWVSRSGVVTLAGDSWSSSSLVAAIQKVAQSQAQAQASSKSSSESPHDPWIKMADCNADAAARNLGNYPGKKFGY
jgi:hypothetical protein